MKIYDISVAISENVPVYEGDPRVKIDVASSIKNGDAANVTQLCFGAHTATHVDAPNHFIEGTRKVHELDLEKFIGACRVVELDESGFGNRARTRRKSRKRRARLVQNQKFRFLE